MPIGRESALFQKERNHSMRFGPPPREVSRHFVIPDQVSEKVKERAFLGRHMTLAFLDHGFHHGKRPLMLLFIMQGKLG